MKKREIKRKEYKKRKRKREREKERENDEGKMQEKSLNWKGGKKIKKERKTSKVRER